jgi:hypothetical protein
MEEKYKFRCKKCGHLLLQDGKALGSNLIFFMCVNGEDFHKDINGGCGEGFWIDVKNRVDNQGYEYR